MKQGVIDVPPSFSQGFHDQGGIGVGHWPVRARWASAQSRIIATLVSGRDMAVRRVRDSWYRSHPGPVSGRLQTNCRQPLGPDAHRGTCL